MNFITLVAVSTLVDRISWSDEKFHHLIKQNKSCMETSASFKYFALNPRKVALNVVDPNEVIPNEKYQ